MDEYTEDELFEMDDDALDAAFAKAKESNEEVVEETEEVESTEDVEVETEELEQPEDELDEVQSEDSDETDDTQEDGEEVIEDDDNKDSDEAEVEADKQDLDESNDKPEDNLEEIIAKPEAISTYKIKADGMELELTSEELIKLAPKGLNYTKKMQEIAPHRKDISIMVDNGLTTDDLNLLVEMKQGNTEAFGRMSKIAGVDTLEIDTEKSGEYIPKTYGKSDVELNIQEVESRIKGDPEYATTRSIVVNQWDTTSWEAMSKDPGMIEDLHLDVKSGVFDKVSPIALKLKALDNGRKSDLDYYIEAGGEYYGKQAAVEASQAEETRISEQRVAEEAQLTRDREAVETAKIEASKQASTKKAATNRKAAATTKKAAGKRNVIDYLDDNDEAYDDWYKKLQDSQ